MRNQRALLFFGLLAMSLLLLGKSYSQFTSEPGTDTQPTQSQQSVLSESAGGEPVSPTLTPIATEIPKSVKLSSTPAPTLSVATPSPSTAPKANNHQETSIEVSPDTQNAADSSVNDAYIEQLRQQEEELQRKREYCQQLHTEVTASIQPLLDKRDAISQNLLEAINRADTKKIAYYQQEQAEVQAEIDAAYQQHYYAFCP